MKNNLLNLDQSVFNYLNSLQGHSNFIDVIIKLIAAYFIWLIPVAILVAWFITHRKLKYRQLLLESYLAGFFAWQVVCRIIGNYVWIRERPTSVEGTKELFFHLPTYSFPSDHAAFLAAFTTYFYLSGLSAEASAKVGYKKLGNTMLVITIIISIARVIAGVHWPMDVLVGWVVGILSALLIWKLRKYYRKYLIEPILWVAKKLRCA